MVYDPSLASLVKNANCDKMICRKKKCGHTKMIRPKKRLK
jgi:ribosomal protein L40E